MANLQIEVGPQVLGDGALTAPRATRGGGAVVQQEHAPYYEAVYRGGVFTASVPVAGVAHGTAFGTTPPLAIWNPVGSGKNLKFIQASLGYISGTLGAGTIAYGQAAQTTTPTGGTAITVRNNLVGNATTGTGQAFSGSTITNTPTLLRPAWLFGPALASSVQFPTLCKDILDGEYIVSPGNLIVMQGIATAGTSPLVLLALTWEEVLA